MLRSPPWLPARVPRCSRHSADLHGSKPAVIMQRRYPERVPITRRLQFCSSILRATASEPRRCPAASHPSHSAPPIGRSPSAIAPRASEDAATQTKTSSSNTPLHESSRQGDYTPLVHVLCHLVALQHSSPIYRLYLYRLYLYRLYLYRLYLYRLYRLYRRRDSKPS